MARGTLKSILPSMPHLLLILREPRKMWQLLKTFFLASLINLNCQWVKTLTWLVDKLPTLYSPCVMITLNDCMKQAWTLLKWPFRSFPAMATRIHRTGGNENSDVPLAVKERLLTCRLSVLLARSHQCNPDFKFERAQNSKIVWERKRLMSKNAIFFL